MKLLLLLLAVHCVACLDYKAEMRRLVIDLSNYARQTNPNFIVIPQNGQEVMTKDGYATSTIDVAYLNAINGVGREDLHYSDDKDNALSSQNEINWMVPFLDLAKRYNKKVLVTDYCWTQSKMAYSYVKNQRLGYISFAAPRRALDVVPTYPAKPVNENSNDITNLNDASNFLYLINPNFATKTDFISTVKKTNYDVVLVDAYFGSIPLTYDDVTSMKRKANGGKRLVIAYMSIGEAEDYRWYWTKGWGVGSPSFVDKENPEWKGNFKVKYWDPTWKSIIYGNDASYTKKLLNAGFDGTYLDIIDAFEYFESLSG